MITADCGSGPAHPLQQPPLLTPHLGPVQNGCLTAPDEIGQQILRCRLSSPRLPGSHPGEDVTQPRQSKRLGAGDLCASCHHRVDGHVSGQVHHQLRVRGHHPTPRVAEQGARRGTSAAKVAVVDHDTKPTLRTEPAEELGPGLIAVASHLGTCPGGPPPGEPARVGQGHRVAKVLSARCRHSYVAPGGIRGLAGHDRTGQVVEELTTHDQTRSGQGVEHLISQTAAPPVCSRVPAVLNPTDPGVPTVGRTPQINADEPQLSVMLGQRAEQLAPAGADINDCGETRVGVQHARDSPSEQPSGGVGCGPEVSRRMLGPPEAARPVRRVDPYVVPGPRIGNHGSMLPDDAPPFPKLPPLPELPQRLAAEAPGWVAEVDIVVVGSGIAGLTAALECRDLGKVMVVTKDVVAAGSTPWAQGGIASVQAEGDTVQQHIDDTMVAGAGLCIAESVRVLVTEGPPAVKKLIERGALFDRDEEGDLELTREGGHHRNRIAHAGGDATGAEIERALVSRVKAAPEIELVEHALVLDLIPATTEDSEPAAVAGVTLHVMGEGTRGGVGAVHARAVILCTGGVGQIYAATTNPPVTTGDGVAVALRAGAELRDIEFIQFHPTVLYLRPGARGQLPLVSEAVRGEGGHLLNNAGERFMVGAHELAELAPRDVVAKAIMTEMASEGSDHVWVDGRMLGEEMWRVRFPTILNSCRQIGINPATDLIPVSPACHYFCGGVATDADGAASLGGLYACGEVASSGVHGANRLASNSLLEGLVFAHRISESLHRELPPRRVPARDTRTPGLIDRSVVPAMQKSMSRYVSGLRDAVGLDQCAAELVRLAATTGAEEGLEAWEATNLMTTATAIMVSARLREESRGAHWRHDFEGRRRAWHGHLLATSDLAEATIHRFVRSANPATEAP